MPDDESQIPDAATFDAPESTQDPADELPDMADALRAQRPDTGSSEPAGSDEDEDDDDDAAEETPTEEPQQEATPDAAPPAAERKPNQRERLRLRAERAEQEATQHKTALEQIQKQRAFEEAQALISLGTPEEFNRLLAKRSNPNESLTYDEEVRFAEMWEKRSAALPLRNLAWNSTNARVTQAAEQAGIEFSMPAPDQDPVDTFTQALKAARAQGAQERADDLARLEADNQSLRSKLAGRSKDPGTGGRSVAGRSDLPDFQTAEPSELWLNALRGNGR